METYQLFQQLYRPVFLRVLLLICYPDLLTLPQGRDRAMRIYPFLALRGWRGDSSLKYKGIQIHLEIPLYTFFHLIDCISQKPVDTLDRQPSKERTVLGVFCVLPRQAHIDYCTSTSEDLTFTRYVSLSNTRGRAN